MKASTTGTVHVVDGGSGDLKTYASHLSQLGYRPACYSDGTSFLRAARKAAAACVLLDWRLPAGNAIEILQELKQLHPGWKVIGYAGNATIEEAVAAMQAGAVDFLLKPVPPDKLAASLAAAEIRPAASRNADLSAKSRVLDNITKRQLDVLRLLIDGHQNKSIAYDLQISERTVEAHRARMMRRLEIQSFAELIALAVRAGIEPDRGKET